MTQEVSETAGLLTISKGYAAPLITDSKQTLSRVRILQLKLKIGELMNSHIMPFLKSAD
jgi:hypothetical protein